MWNIFGLSGIWAFVVFGILALVVWNLLTTTTA